MRTSSLRTLAIAALGLAALIIGFSAFLALRSRGITAQLRGTPLAPPRSATPLQLTDQSGADVTFPSPSAPYTVVFFGYTHCPDVCPLGMATMAKADRELGHPKDLALAFVTVDPARDTPAVLTAFTRSFDSRIVGYTGAPGQLAKLWNAFGVLVAPASRELVHGESIYLVDASGRILVEYPPQNSAAYIESDVRTVLGPH